MIKYIAPTYNSLVCFSMQLNDDRNQSYVQALDQAISNYSPQLIFCVLFNAKADKYSAIKKRSLVDRAGKGISCLNVSQVYIFLNNFHRMMRENIFKNIFGK